MVVVMEALFKARRRGETWPDIGTLGGPQIFSGPEIDLQGSLGKAAIWLSYPGWMRRRRELERCPRLDLAVHK